MHDSVKELGGKRNNRLYGNVWIECKERVHRRDEHSHVIICDCKREGCGAKLPRMVLCVYFKLCFACNSEQNVRLAGAKEMYANTTSLLCFQAGNFCGRCMTRMRI